MKPVATVLASILVMSLGCASRQGPAHPPNTEESSSTAATATTATPDPVPELMAEVDRKLSELLASFQARADSDPPSSLVEKVQRELTYMSAADKVLRDSVRLPIERRLSGEDIDSFNTQLAIRTLEVDRAHSRRVLDLAEAHGWFRISVYGAQADAQAWQLVQRAADDLPLQKAVLGILKVLVPLGDTSAENYARLADQIAVAESRPQIFGTNGECLSPDTWEPTEVENPEGLEARRAAIGLGSMEQQAEKSAASECR